MRGDNKRVARAPKTKPNANQSNEIGIKGEWPNQGISGSFAVFEVEQDNYGIRDSSRTTALSDGSFAYVGVNGRTQYRLSGVLQPVELGALWLWQGQMDAVKRAQPFRPTTVKQSPFGLLNLSRTGTSPRPPASIRP